MKILYIEHGVGNYGAQKSLGLLLKAVNTYGSIGESNTFLINDFLSFKKIPLAQQNSEMVSCKNRFQMILPSCGLSFPQKPSLVFYFHIIIRQLLFSIIYKHKLLKIVNDESIDIVHLNNSGLWPLIPILRKKTKVIMHERGWQKEFQGSLLRLFMKNAVCKAECIITIGDLEVQYYQHLELKNLKILSNPIDMTAVKELQVIKGDLIKKYGLRSGYTIIALIGYIDELKGVDFLINAINFINKTSPNNKLLWIVVGDTPNKKYKDMFIKKIINISNIYYLGEINKIDEIYAISDVIVRCEDYYPYGRTVIEALYSKKQVVLPYKDKNDCKIEKTLKDNFVSLYKARDIDDFSKALYEAIGKTGDSSYNLLPYSNLQEYALKLIGIYENILKEPF